MKKNLLLKWFAVRIEMDWVFIKPLSKLAAYLKKGCQRNREQVHPNQRYDIDSREEAP